MARGAALLSAVLVAGGCAAESILVDRLPVNERQWTDRYDAAFRKYAKRFFGVGLDWRWFKAQGIAESSLQADARSWVGAQGIMQITELARQEIEKQTLIADITDPKWNIAAGVFYDRHLYDLWTDVPGGRVERLAFTFASYNAGRRRTLQARARCASACNRWVEVADYAPDETRGYVERIMGLMAASG